MKVASSAVVVTGIGLCTPAGARVAEAWDVACAGRSGVGAADPGRGSVEGARAVARCPGADRPPALRVAKYKKYAGRASSCALHAVQEAVAQAGWTDGSADPLRIAVHGATGQTGLEVEEFFPALTAAWAEDPACDYARLGGTPSRLVEPHFSLRTLSNAAVALVASELQARGPSANYVQGETAGAHALRSAWHDLREDRADVAVVFACDSLPHPSTWLAYGRMGLLSRRDPEVTPSPFDRDRDGLVLGEGGAALVLERAGSARGRGAAVLAEVLGVEVATPREPAVWCLGSDALGACLARAARLLAGAGRDARACAERPAGVFIVARGLGTREHDTAEAAALVRGAGTNVPVTAFKGATGYLGAATAVAETVIAIRALQAGVVPPVSRLVVPDAACGALPLLRAPLTLDAAAPGAITLGATWGGEWAAVAVRGPAGSPR